jgi:hypothetical protein
VGFGFLGGSISQDSSPTQWHGTRVTALQNSILTPLGVSKLLVFLHIKCVEIGDVRRRYFLLVLCTLT